jgi:hypothetical protein
MITGGYRNSEAIQERIKAVVERNDTSQVVEDAQSDKRSVDAKP